jgi:hypothetical protein
MEHVAGTLVWFSNMEHLFFATDMEHHQTNTVAHPVLPHKGKVESNWALVGATCIQV